MKYKLSLPILRRGSKESTHDPITPPDSPKERKHSVLWSTSSTVQVEGPSSSHDPFWPGSSYFSAASKPFRDAPPFASESSGLKVIIVGAGFAGLSAAIACRRQGFQVTLLERSSGPSKHGDCLTIGSNAAKLLRRWGNGELTEEMWKVSAKGGAWLLKDQDGKILRTEDLKDFPMLYGSPVLQGSRSQFAGLLGVEARLNLVDMKLSTDVLRYIDSPKSPAVVVRSGGEDSTLFADVIIVADGINGKGRALIDEQLRAAAPDPPLDGQPSLPRRSRYSVHRGLVKSAAIKENPSISYLLDGCTRTWVGDDCHLTMASLANGREISFAFVHSDLKGTASVDWRDSRPITEVVELLMGWDEDLVAAIKSFGKCLQWQKTEESASERWISNGGKIVLIGDTVHPLPPSSFQGGSQAIESGGVLAICLALAGAGDDLKGVSRGLKAFERIRKPRVEEALAVGQKQRELWHTWKSTGCLPSHLDLLVAKAYRFDAELNAMTSFERAVQEDEPSFGLQEELKHTVLAKLEVGKEGPMPNYYPPGLRKPMK